MKSSIVEADIMKCLGLGKCVRHNRASLCRFPFHTLYCNFSRAEEYRQSFKVGASWEFQLYVGVTILDKALSWKYVREICPGEPGEELGKLRRIK